MPLPKVEEIQQFPLKYVLNPLVAQIDDDDSDKYKFTVSFELLYKICHQALCNTTWHLTESWEVDTWEDGVQESALELFEEGYCEKCKIKPKMSEEIMDYLKTIRDLYYLSIKKSEHDEIKNITPDSFEKLANGDNFKCLLEQGNIFGIRNYIKTAGTYSKLELKLCRKKGTNPASGPESETSRSATPHSTPDIRNETPPVVEQISNILPEQIPIPESASTSAQLVQYKTVQLAPIQPTTIQPTSILSTPIQPTPIRPTPIKPAPIQSSHIQPTQLQSSQIQPTPIQVSTIQPTQIQVSTIQATPIQHAPIQSTIQNISWSYLPQQNCQLNIQQSNYQFPIFQQNHPQPNVSQQNIQQQAHTTFPQNMQPTVIQQSSALQASVPNKPCLVTWTGIQYGQQNNQSAPIYNTANTAGQPRPNIYGQYAHHYQNIPNQNTQGYLLQLAAQNRQAYQPTSQMMTDQITNRQLSHSTNRGFSGTQIAAPKTTSSIGQNDPIRKPYRPILNKAQPTSTRYLVENRLMNGDKRELQELEIDPDSKNFLELEHILRHPKISSASSNICNGDMFIATLNNSRLFFQKKLYNVVVYSEREETKYQAVTTEVHGAVPLDFKDMMPISTLWKSVTYNSRELEPEFEFEAYEETHAATVEVAVKDKPAQESINRSSSAGFRSIAPEISVIANSSTLTVPTATVTAATVPITTMIINQPALSQSVSKDPITSKSDGKILGISEPTSGQLGLNQPKSNKADLYQSVMNMLDSNALASNTVDPNDDASNRMDSQEPAKTKLVLSKSVVKDDALSRVDLIDLTSGQAGSSQLDSSALDLTINTPTLKVPISNESAAGMVVPRTSNVGKPVSNEPSRIQNSSVSTDSSLDKGTHPVVHIPEKNLVELETSVNI